MRISDWSSDVCSSDLGPFPRPAKAHIQVGHRMERRAEAVRIGRAGEMTMLDRIDSADDVIALKISDKISGRELDAIMDRLDAAMARHDKVHIFIETRSIYGIEIAGLPSYAARALPLLDRKSTSLNS